MCTASAISGFERRRGLARGVVAPGALRWLDGVARRATCIRACEINGARGVSRPVARNARAPADPGFPVLRPVHWNARSRERTSNRTSSALGRSGCGERGVERSEGPGVPCRASRLGGQPGECSRRRQGPARGGPALAWESAPASAPLSRDTRRGPPPAPTSAAAVRRRRRSGMKRVGQRVASTRPRGTSCSGHETRRAAIAAALVVMAIAARDRRWGGSRSQKSAALERMASVFEARMALVFEARMASVFEARMASVF